MEKQPIDDLFARKLREADLPPSPDAFNRLQSRMASAELPTAKRRVVMWWYGAAAASLFLVALFYFRSSPDVKKTALNQIVKQTKAVGPNALGPKQPPAQLVAKAGQKERIQTDFVPTGNNVLKERQLKVLVIETKQVARMEEAKIVTIGTETGQKAVVQSLDIPPIIAKNESAAVTANPSVALRIAQPKLLATNNRADEQRVVVMTIAEPATDIPVVALQSANVESTAQTQPGSIASLFAKVKQLKNGDALARATPTKRPADTRSRLGRVFEGMKESLKNETTLE